MNYFTKWRLSLLKSIQLQLFISLISLPFLVCWGLPISIFSLFSTIFFGPFLTIFLLISSCLFFCELLYLPNGLFVYLLEIVTQSWLSILNINQQWWLIGFTNPHPIMFVIIVLCTFIILHNKHIKTIQTHIIYLVFLFIISCLILKFFPYQYNLIEKIACNNGVVTIVNHDNQLIFVDPGVLGARPSFESFILYTLVPEIVKKTGKMTIDHLVLCKINKRTFDAINFLSTKMNIKTVYLPWWTGKIPLFAWSSYVKLKKSIFASHGTIKSISKKLVLLATKKSSFFVEPNATKTISYHNATYPLLSIKGIINKHSIAL